MTLPASASLPNYPCFANARQYDAEWLRMTNQCWAGGEGIAPFDQSKDCTVTSMGSNKATDLEVTTGSFGLNVSVAAGNAWVTGDGRSTQGLYFCYVDVAKTVTLPTAHATLPRVDAIILKVDDADVSGSSTQWSVTYQQGIATSGANLTNLTGAPGQGGGPTFQTTALLLAYVLTTAAFAGPYVNATHILDQRCFAYRPGRLLGRLTATTDSTGNGDKLGPLTVMGNGVNPIAVASCGHSGAAGAGQTQVHEIRDAASGGGNLLAKGLEIAAGAAPSYGCALNAYAPRVAAFSGQKNLYQRLTSSGIASAYDSTWGTTRSLEARYV